MSTNDGRSVVTPDEDGEFAGIHHRSDTANVPVPRRLEDHRRLDLDDIASIQEEQRVALPHRSGNDSSADCPATNLGRNGPQTAPGDRKRPFNPPRIAHDLARGKDRAECLFSVQHADKPKNKARRGTPDEPLRHEAKPLPPAPPLLPPTRCGSWRRGDGVPHPVNERNRAPLTRGANVRETTRNPRWSVMADGVCPHLSVVHDQPAQAPVQGAKAPKNRRGDVPQDVAHDLDGELIEHRKDAGRVVGGKGDEGHDRGMGWW